MNLDFNRICRLCLRFCEECVDLYQSNGVRSLSTEIMEKIKFCYLIKIDVTDGLPTKICYQCIQVLSYFYVTKKNALCSEQLLKDVLYMRKRIEENEVLEEGVIVRPSVVEIVADIHRSNSTPVITHNASKRDFSSGSIDFSSNFQNGSDNEHEDKDKNEVNQYLEFKKKRKLLKTSSDYGNGLQGILEDKKNQELECFNSRDIKKLKCRHKAVSKPLEVVKATPGVKAKSEEKIVRVIGTVIDKSNILSPNIKRQRKSVLAS